MNRFRVRGRSASQLFRGADRSGTASLAASLEKEAERRRSPARAQFPLSGGVAGGRTGSGDRAAKGRDTGARARAYRKYGVLARGEARLEEGRKWLCRRGRAGERRP